MAAADDRRSLLAHGAAGAAVTSLVLFVPANLLPFMTMEAFGQETHPTIWGGVVSLYETGSPLLAALVFAASIVLPLLKIFVVLVLLPSLSRGAAAEASEKTVLVFDLVGRWAMLDVFLLAIFVAVMKFGTMGSAAPALGAVLFSLVVVATMVAYSCMEKLLKHRGPAPA